MTGAAPAYNPAYRAEHITPDQRTYYVHRDNGTRTGWTRVRGSRQAERERYAWEAAGWTASIHPATPEVLAAVREWEGGRS